MKIAITGATGQLGQLVIQALLKTVSATQIVALVRNQSKAESFAKQGIELRHFDYDTPETLVPALTGIDKLLLISANEIGRRTPQHKAVIEAAKQANVPYIAYTSLLHADTSPLGLAQEHRETEVLIQASGLNYTFLRNNWYSDNYLTGIAQIVESGVVYGASQDGKISSASRADYAEATAKVLSSTGHDHKIYELAGSESFTKADLAQFISLASGKDVIYQNLTAEELSQGLTQAGLPAELVHVIVDADIQTAKGAMFSDSQELENLIGHPSTTILAQIRTALSAS